MFNKFCLFHCGFFVQTEIALLFHSRDISNDYEKDLYVDQCHTNFLKQVQYQHFLTFLDIKEEITKFKHATFSNFLGEVTKTCVLFFKYQNCDEKGILERNVFEKV